MLVDERTAVREPNAVAHGRPRWWTPRTRNLVLLCTSCPPSAGST
ncbi:hypothetical protein [Spongiactinospora sp. 9N601]